MNFCNVLEAWYLSNSRDLPWRKTKDPYYVWLSEIILQQTRVAQGISYYYKFIEAFPTVFDLANAEEEQVLKLWQGLGYYSRARNLHFSAKLVVNELNGVFPNTYKDLLQLKGVGDYTASAIASFCFNEAAAVVDGNVYRVLARYFGVHTTINSNKGIKEFKEIAQEVLDYKNPGLYNQAVMEFGALHCKPQNPLCGTCPFNGSCKALEKKEVQLLPIKEKKIKIRKRYFNFIVVQTLEHKTILSKRIGKGIWENLYQFPLIETEATTSALNLIENQEYNELIGGKDANLRLFNSKEWVHKLSHQHLYVQFWIVGGEIDNKDVISIDELERYPVPRIIHKFIEAYDFDVNSVDLQEESGKN